MGDSFKEVSLRHYHKALKRVEDREDYETGQRACQEDHALEEEPADAFSPEDANCDPIIEFEKITKTLPPVFLFGMRLIDRYSGNFHSFREESESEEGPLEGRALEKEEEGEERGEEPDRDGIMDIRPPDMVSRERTLAIVKEERERFKRLYGGG